MLHALSPKQSPVSSPTRSRSPSRSPSPTFLWLPHKPSPPFSPKAASASMQSFNTQLFRQPQEAGAFLLASLILTPPPTPLHLDPGFCVCYEEGYFAMEGGGLS